MLFDGGFPGSWGRWTPQRPTPERIRLVTDMPRRDLLTARFDLQPGDQYTDGRARSEVYALDYLYEGDERYIGWSFFLPADFPASTADWWHILAQLKQRGVGSPPISLEIAGSADQLRVQHNLAPSFTYWKGNASWFRGKWTDIVLHVKSSRDPAVGFLELWLNGTPRELPTSSGVLRKYAPTMDPNGEPSYPKLGYYRELSCDLPGVVFHNGYRMGESYDEVAA